MKLLTPLILLATCLNTFGAAVSPGLPISRYPNRGTPQGPDLFILAVTNQVPATNMNVSFNQVSNAIVGAINSGFLNFETLTNGIRVALSTNANWTFGVTGYVSGTSLNLGVDSSQFAPAALGVGLAPGTTVILVDGATNSIVNRTSVVTSAVSVIFTNMQVGLPIRWWGFSSNGAWDISVPQSHTSNTVSRGIEQPFSNTWVMIEAIAFSSGWTNFDSEAQGYTLSPGVNVTFTTNNITQEISVSSVSSTNFFNGEVSVTNATTIGLVYDQILNTNRLRSFSPGNNIAITNEGTNIVIASTVTATGLLTGTTNFIQLSIQAAKIPNTNFPAFENGYQDWETIYYETNINGNRVTLNASWQFVVPPDYSTNSLNVRLLTALVSTNGPNTSNTIFQASIFRATPGDSTDLHTNTFGFTVSGTNTWAASFDGTNKLQSMVISLGTNSLLAAGDLAILKLGRDAINDTYGGAVAAVGLRLEYTRP